MIRALKHWLIGGHGDIAMPPRIAAQIEREQQDSEILIGWIQLAGVTFFAVVYAIVPKTFDPDMMFAPVPWALGLYFVFTVARLILAQGRRLPPWMVTLSVIFDMAALAGDDLELPPAIRPGTGVLAQGADPALHLKGTSKNAFPRFRSGRIRTT